MLFLEWITLPEVLAGLAAAGVAGLLMTGYWRVRQRLGQQLHCLEGQRQDLAALRAELTGQASALGEHSRLLAALIDELKIDHRFASAASGGDSRGLDRAVRCAQQGATEDELVADYGMSRQEAMFLRRLHGKSGPDSQRRAVS